jgi:hypothetical protein
MPRGSKGRRRGHDHKPEGKGFRRAEMHWVWGHGARSTSPSNQKHALIHTRRRAQQHRRSTHRGSASLQAMASTTSPPPPARRTRNATECSCMPRRPILVRITRPYIQRIAKKTHAARARADAASHTPTTPASRKASPLDHPASPHCQLLLAANTLSTHHRYPSFKRILAA